MDVGKVRVRDLQKWKRKMSSCLIFKEENSKEQVTL